MDNDTTTAPTTAYLVAAGEYEDRRVIAVLAVETEAHEFADDHNLRTQPRPGFWAEVEPTNFYPAGWRPAPRTDTDTEPTFAIGTTDPYTIGQTPLLHYVRAATEDDAAAEARERHGRATGLPTADVSTVSYGDMSTSPEWTTP